MPFGMLYHLFTTRWSLQLLVTKDKQVNTGGLGTEIWPASDNKQIRFERADRGTAKTRCRDFKQTEIL